MSESSGQIKQFVKSCGRRDIKEKCVSCVHTFSFQQIRVISVEILKIASEVIEILNEVLRMLWMYGIPIYLDGS